MPRRTTRILGEGTNANVGFPSFESTPSGRSATVADRPEAVVAALLESEPCDAHARSTAIVDSLCSAYSSLTSSLNPRGAGGAGSTLPIHVVESSSFLIDI